MNKVLLRNLRKMANESPVVKVKMNQKLCNMTHQIDIFLIINSKS